MLLLLLDYLVSDLGRALIVPRICLAVVAVLEAARGVSSRRRLPVRLHRGTGRFGYLEDSVRALHGSEVCQFGRI